MIVKGTGHVSLENPLSEPLDMEFEDGVHTISEAVVAHLGGTEVVKTMSEKFKKVTFQNFISGFWRLIVKTKLNDVGQNIIGAHLRKFGR